MILIKLIYMYILVRIILIIQTWLADQKFQLCLKFLKNNPIRETKETHSQLVCESNMKFSRVFRE